MVVPGTVHGAEGSVGRVADTIYADFLTAWREVFAAVPRPRAPDGIWSASSGEAVRRWGLVADRGADPLARFSALAEALTRVPVGEKGGDAFVLVTLGEPLLVEALAAPWWRTVADPWLEMFRRYPPVADHWSTNGYLVSDLSRASMLNETPPDHLEPYLWGGFWDATDAWLWSTMVDRHEGSYGGHLSDERRVFDSWAWRRRLADCGARAASLLEDPAGLTVEQEARLVRVRLAGARLGHVPDEDPCPSSTPRPRGRKAHAARCSGWRRIPLPLST